MSSHREPAHVVIVGAGPAGALTAFLLVRMGIRVTLIERHSDFAREFRGEGMTPGGMAAIREAGLWDAFDALPCEPIRRLQMFAGGRRFLALDMQAILPRDAELIRLMPQPKLLEMLVHKCADHPGFSLMRGAVARDLIMDGERVAGVIVGSDGVDRAVRADYVIGADGRFSGVRKRLGLELEGNRQAFDVVWCRVPRAEPVAKGTAYSFLVDDYFGLAFPAEGDHVQIGRIIAKGSYRAFRGGGDEAWKDHLASVLPPPLAQMFAQVRDRASDPFLLDVICGMLPRWSVPGLVMLGDAAHPMSPVAAQGINIALRDAIVLANHLGPALVEGHQGEVLDRAAEAFEAERRPEVARIQAEQNAAAQRVARIEAIAPFIRLIPAGLIAGLGRFLLSRSSIRRFIEGAAKIELTFKPEGVTQ